MTDKFKQVADSLNKYKPHLSGMGGSIGTAELGVFTRNHIDILTEALYLAQDNEDSAVRYYKVCLELADKRIEAEQLRKELNGAKDALELRTTCYDQLIKACRENDELRKERDELANAIIKIHEDQEGDYDFLKFISHPEYILAKKVNENGNA